LTDEQNRGLDEEQRGELARRTAGEAALLGQGQQELRIEPVRELRQRGAERRGRRGLLRSALSVVAGVFAFGASVIPKIENRIASKDLEISLTIFHARVRQNYPDAYVLQRGVGARL